MSTAMPYGPIANLFLLVCIFYFAFKIKQSAVGLQLQHKQERDKPVGYASRDLVSQAQISVADLYQLFSKYLGETSDAIAVIDTEYKFIAANSRMEQDFEELFGRKHQLGVSVLDLFAHKLLRI